MGYRVKNRLIEYLLKLTERILMQTKINSTMKLKTSDRVLMLIMLVLASVPVVIILPHTDLVSHMTKVDSEAVTGLLTISGLIFAFQATYFRKPKTVVHQLMFTAIFLVETLLLALTGLGFVNDVSNLGNTSTTTLFVAFGSLIYNMSMTVFFVLFDIFVLSIQDMGAQS